MALTLLHIFPSFAAGGIQMRLGAIVAKLPNDWDHVVVALDDTYDALHSGVWPDTVSRHQASFVSNEPALKRFSTIRKTIKDIDPDLVLTNNWGAIEWALVARTLRGLPHIHTESGFGADEAFKLNPKRSLFRRLVLPGAKAVLLCSQTLVAIAREQWRLPPDKTHFVPDGIDLNRFGKDRSAPLPLGNDLIDDNSIVIGCVAPLRPEKNLTALLDAFELASARNKDLHLAIAGDGPERAKLEAHAKTLESADKITFCGFLTEIERFYASIDICALSSDTEQLPNSILQAMCAGLPIAAFDVGDIPVMVAPENQPFLVARRDIAALAEAMNALASDPAARHKVGAANEAVCLGRYGQDAMVATYKHTIDAALGFAAKDVL